MSSSDTFGNTARHSVYSQQFYDHEDELKTLHCLTNAILC